ncbi:MAG: D-alanyl-D-alanine carboxypeptidase, partial [Nitrospirae bacterium]|nr:D-alanyl-D-alanine carboxypeptidase [Nitrospirota bacterium]
MSCRAKWGLLAALFFLSLPLIVVSAGPVETNFSVKSLQLIDSVKSSLPLNAKWSFSAIDVETGKKILDEGNTEGIPLIPGSIVKLFVTAAILDVISNEKIETDTLIAHDGDILKGRLEGNLYIKGSGNAFLSEADLAKAIGEIRSRGVKVIEGDIIADDSLFDTRGWRSKYHGPAYASPGALGLDLHTVSINVSGRPPDVKIEPCNDAVMISFNPNGKLDIRRIDDFRYEVSGRLSSRSFIKKRFPLSAPAIYAAWTFKTLLKRRDI